MVSGAFGYPVIHKLHKSKLSLNRSTANARLKSLEALNTGQSSL
jgi:hypothetical protein